MIIPTALKAAAHTMHEEARASRQSTLPDRKIELGRQVLADLRAKEAANVVAEAKQIARDVVAQCLAAGKSDAQALAAGQRAANEHLTSNR